jgi:hypothetical protein
MSLLIFKPGISIKGSSPANEEITELDRSDGGSGVHSKPEIELDLAGGRWAIGWSISTEPIAVDITDRWPMLVHPAALSALSALSTREEWEE